MVIKFLPLFALLVATSCACTGKPVRSPLLGTSALPTGLSGAAKPAWKFSVTGLITDYATSESGTATALLTAPHPDIPGSGKDRFLVRLNARGRPVWRKKLDFSARDVAVSSDGAMIFLSTYDDRVLAFRESGQLAWTARGTCRPTYLTKTARVFCYHDDDADPKIGFEVFEARGPRAGKVVTRFAIDHDILSYALAEDEQTTVLALANGWIVLVNSEFREVWRRQLGAEVLDVAVQDGEVLALTARGVKLFRADGSIAAEGAPRLIPEQLIFAGPSRWAGYSNTAEGQFMTLNQATAGGWTEQWRQGVSFEADYNLGISSAPGAKSSMILALAVEQPPQVAGQADRRSDVVIFREDGKIIATVPLTQNERGEGDSYLYRFGFANRARLVMVLSDDGTLAAYSLASYDKAR